ncbi:uncharacterized protein LOC100372484, partial [Saccoglossus kowalevskii]
WRSPTNDVWVKWESDGSVTRNGWLLSLIAQEACYETVTLDINDVHSITSPDYPSSYSDLLYCVWIVQADETRSINVHFIDFNIRSNRDYFSGGVGDDPEDSSTQAFVYSGNTLPQDWYSESTKIWLRFTTDGAYSRLNEGFHVELQDDFYCENIGIPQCENHLPYGGSTFYSHLGLSREQAMDRMDKMADIEGCHEHIELFMCSLLSPQCGINGTYRQPCKAFCDDVELMCALSYEEYGYGWPVNCTYMPTSDERPDCVRISPCLNNPCLHGGTCLPVDELNSTCICSGGYTGELCEIDIDECASNPCQNGGTCFDLVGGFSCWCAYGWIGTKCECSDITIEVCRSLPLNMARLTKYLPSADRSSSVRHLEQFLMNMRYNRAGTPCHPHMDYFMCALFAPDCSEDGFYRPPCKYFCEDVRRTCESTFNNGGIQWPVECDLLPFSNDTSICVVNPTESEFCGTTPAESNRIVGGSDASLGTYPWQVSLHEYGSHICGAVVINENWIATAAHCVVSSSPYDLEVRMGFISQQAGSVHEYRTGVHSVFVHPSYNNYLSSNDFALLYVDTPIIYSDYIRPACLPPSGDSTFFNDGEVCAISGWGETYSGGTPDILQEATVPLVNQQTCNSRYDGDVTESMICAGYLDVGGIDSCYGDSGGPLVCQKSNGRWYLAGLTSWGNGCADSYYPGVYARITHGRSWIDEIMSTEP